MISAYWTIHLLDLQEVIFFPAMRPTNKSATNDAKDTSTTP